MQTTIIKRTRRIQKETKNLPNWIIIANDWPIPWGISIVIGWMAGLRRRIESEQRFASNIKASAQSSLEFIAHIKCRKSRKSQGRFKMTVKGNQSRFKESNVQTSIWYSMHWDIQKNFFGDAMQHGIEAKYDEKSPKDRKYNEN